MEYSQYFLTYTLLPELKAVADPQRATRQIQYLKNHFQCLGVRAPEVRKISYRLINTHELVDSPNAIDLMETAIDAPFREIHHFGIHLVLKYVSKSDDYFHHTLEKMITTNSWWDSVDGLAGSVDQYLRKYPKKTYELAYRWMESENIWLQRSAILFQLKRKETTDTELLKAMILSVADSKEYFLQKAAGWALRQYAKTNPAWVGTFINGHKLPTLTVREGSKYL